MPESVTGATPTSVRARLRGLVLRLIAGAIIGVGLAFVPLAQYTCALALWSDSPRLLQRVPSETEPYPTALLWSDGLYRVLTAVGGMPLAGALAVYIAFTCALGYVIVRAINPSFRVTTGVDWDRWLLFRTYMHTAPLIKVIVITVPSFVMGFAIWSLARLAVPVESLHAGLAGAVFGAVGWIMLSRDGVIGDCDSGNYQLPATGQLLGMAARGALFGICVVAIMGALLVLQPERLLKLVAAMGGLGERGWRPAALVWLVSSATAGAWIVGVALILGKPGDTAVRSWQRVASAAVLTAAYVVLVSVWVPGYVRSHYDYDLRTEQPVRPVWWRVSDGPDHLRTDTWIATATDSGEWVVRPVARAGASGVDLSAGSVERMGKHLERRRYRTALLTEGAMALYDHGALELDADRRLRVAVAVVRQSGDPTFSRVFLEDLAAQAGTASASEYLRVLGDRRAYSYPTYDARLPVGDLHALNGDVTAARAWYLRAGLPEARAIERAGRMLAPAKSAIIGRVENAVPELEVRVGLVRGRGGSLDPRAARTVEPFDLRQVIRAARVTPSGAFSLREVRKGDYVLVLWLRSRDGRSLTSLRIKGMADASQPIECDGLSETDIGTLHIER